MITHHDRPQAPNGFTWQLHCDRCGAQLSSPRAWPSHLLTAACVDARGEQPDLEGRGPLDQPAAKLQAEHAATSLDAAVRAAKVSGGARRRILGELIGHGAATDLELTEQLDMNPSTVRPRRLELVEAGYVEDTGNTRPTPSGGRATVWAVTPAGKRAWREQRPDRQRPAPPGVCGATRPGTLGYQRCQLGMGHLGDHRSQDRQPWSA